MEYFMDFLKRISAHLKRTIFQDQDRKIIFSKKDSVQIYFSKYIRKV